MSGNNGGPWGSGGSNKGGGKRDDDRRPAGPNDGPQIPEIDDLMRKGQEQLKVLMGGRGGRGGGGRPGGGGDGGPGISKGMIGLGALAAVGLYLFSSFYTVKPEEQGVELLLGEYFRTTDNGPHFAWWPFVTVDVIAVTTERTEEIGVAANSRSQTGLMLTTDANIVDIDFQVVWNINDPAKLLFNIADPRLTVQAVSESVMREIIAASNLAPILNRDREAIAIDAQATLNEYEAGINIVRVNLLKADPPAEVIDSFRQVQAAEQERDRLERTADAYANTKLAGARGEAAQTLEEAEGYRAQVVNEALGEASRFSAVLEEYSQAPDVIRKRLYLETMERVLGDVDKMILDPSLTGSDGAGGIVPYLPLNELTRSNGGN
jgi:modulator of FtsH protease HflK